MKKNNFAYLLSELIPFRYEQLYLERNIMKFTNILMAIFASSIILGCTQTTKALGIKKNAPNEFNILTKAPLVVPPEYNLRPPQIGTSSSENNYSQESAREALLGNIDEVEPTRGEVVLMSKAGVGSANPEIRLEIDGSNSVERKSRGFSDQVLFWKDGSSISSNSTPMDSDVEAKRLEAIISATGGKDVKITKRPGAAKLPGL